MSHPYLQAPALILPEKHWRASVSSKCHTSLAPSLHSALETSTPLSLLLTTKSNKISKLPKLNPVTTVSCLLYCCLPLKFCTYYFFFFFFSHFRVIYLLLPSSLSPLLLLPSEALLGPGSHSVALTPSYSPSLPTAMSPSLFPQNCAICQTATPLTFFAILISQ